MLDGSREINTNVEMTLGAYHSRSTEKVYYADPYEIVPDSIKEEVDAVVHDSKPEFPDIDKNVSRSYFEKHNFDNCGQKYENIRDFYYRVEMMDAKKVAEYESEMLLGKQIDINDLNMRRARINDSKHNQWLAQECLNIYNLGYDLRYQKGSLENDLEKIIKEERECNFDLYTKNQKLEIQESEKALREKNIDVLGKRIKAYKLLQGTPEYIVTTIEEKQNSYDRLISKYNQDIQLINKEKQFLEEKIPFVEKLLVEQKGLLKTSKEAISNLHDEISKLTKELADKSKIKSEKYFELNNVRAKLMPLFDKLKDLYIKEHIVIR